METLWSVSTTIREAERIPDFVKTAREIDGEAWTREAQEKFQILLIKNRQYLNSGKTQDFNKLSQDQVELLKNKGQDMTYEEARGIFDAKDYESPDMRGRQSMAPLVKLGLVDKSSGFIRLTDAGRKLADDEITIEQFMFDSLLKTQYPNQTETEHRTWNTKPLINTFRLIKRVNELCREQKRKEKGVTKLEFGIFVLSLQSWEDIEDTANRIISFRKDYESLSGNAEKEEYVEEFISLYLADFKNPIRNVKEYTDNIIRYMRITKYIYIRGKYGNACVDLEPRRMVEINALLDHDNGRARKFSETEWITYFGTYGSYELPFETAEKLTEILKAVQDDNNRLETKLGMAVTVTTIPVSVPDLKAEIEELRTYRTKLQNLEIKYDYKNDIGKIDEAVDALKNIRKLDLKPSIALEKWANIALNIINDSELIKPNSIVGDDNEPTFTAPAGVSDIECYYKNFNATCEVTMLTGRDQWYNEGQPVMRHLREFEDQHPEKPAYCLFIAPSLHVDAVETFFHGVRYKYRGRFQKIVPITISQLISILETVKEMKAKGKAWSHLDIMRLYDSCTRMDEGEDDSTTWLPKVREELSAWEKQMVG